jgi:hypothetical protein
MSNRCCRDCPHCRHLYHQLYRRLQSQLSTVPSLLPWIGAAIVFLHVMPIENVTGSIQVLYVQPDEHQPRLSTALV